MSAETVPAASTTSRTRWRVAGAVAVLGVLALAAVGWSGTSGPSTTPFAHGHDVLLISIPGLQWHDLDGSDTPELDRFLGASALLSVRALGPTTTRTEHRPVRVVTD